MYPDEIPEHREQERIDNARRTALVETLKASEFDTNPDTIVASARVFAGFLLNG